MAYDSNIPKFNDEMQKAVNKALFEVGTMIKSSAKQNAPHDMGQLRNSIKFRTTGQGDVTNVTIGSTLEYAVYQEFGTGEFAENGVGRKGGWVYTNGKGVTKFTLGNKPTKFMRKAFRENKQRIQAKLEETLRGLE